MTVRLDRITLTEQQLRELEIVLYRGADVINRLMADNHVPYTKVVAQPQQYPAPQGIAGQLAPVPTPQASQIAPPGGY